MALEDKERATEARQHAARVEALQSKMTHRAVPTSAQAIADEVAWAARLPKELQLSACATAVCKLSTMRGAEKEQACKLVPPQLKKLNLDMQFEAWGLFLNQLNNPLTHDRRDPYNRDALYDAFTELPFWMKVPVVLHALDSDCGEGGDKTGKSRLMNDDVLERMFITSHSGSSIDLSASIKEASPGLSPSSPSSPKGSTKR